ncbi:hypothetical protein RJZ57_007982 [Blastomyces gilchristii]|nr:hypothetical protein BDFG_08116 [Blastomyces dermatitidis ATCC 26199]
MAGDIPVHPQRHAKWALKKVIPSKAPLAALQSTQPVDPSLFSQYFFQIITQISAESTLIEW